MIPTWIQAGLWGLLSGGALVLGAAIGFFARVPQRVVAAVMAFGSGVLISALAFELVTEAEETGGIWATIIGFVAGAGTYTIANLVLAARGAAARKRSGHQQPSEGEEEGSGLAIAVGALIDGIPESLVVGLSLLVGGEVAFVTVIAIFLSNLPEGLSSAAGMRKAGRGAGYVFGVWGGIAVLSGVAAAAGYLLGGSMSPFAVAVVTAAAAGAILAMLSDTMIPEAFAVQRAYMGVFTVMGFLAAYVLQRWGEG